MRTFSWNVDDRNRVRLGIGAFGRERVWLNEKIVHSKPSFRMRNTIAFGLEDGRQASISIAADGLAPSATLRIDGNLVLTDSDAVGRACPKCRAPSGATHKFCEKCGSALPTPEEHVNTKNLGEAKKVILWLAVIFTVFGIIMFFIQGSVARNGLKNLSSYQAEQLYPEKINGRSYTIGDLRTEIQAEPWLILGMNLLLAAIMVGLSFYANKSPLSATLIATAIYAVVQVGNAIQDPRSLAQGTIMKILIISLLIKGIRSGLALRASKQVKSVA